MTPRGSWPALRRLAVEAVVQPALVGPSEVSEPRTRPGRSTGRAVPTTYYPGPATRDAPCVLMHVEADDEAVLVLRREATARNYQRYYDEYVLADEVGFDGLMINWHGEPRSRTAPMP